MTDGALAVLKNRKAQLEGNLLRSRNQIYYLIEGANRNLLEIKTMETELVDIEAGIKRLQNGLVLDNISSGGLSEVPVHQEAGKVLYKTRL